MAAAPPAGRIPLSERLGATAFDSDKVTHLKLSDPGLCQKCASRACIPVCPAQVYAWEENHLRVSYENCLETGACRVACQELGNHALIWAFPAGGKGVKYRLG